MFHSLVLTGALWTTSMAASSPYDDLVCSYPWDCQKALRIMFCESSNIPTNYANNNYGLFQINGVHAQEFTLNNDPREFYDPYLNINTAFSLYQRRGWQPWIACRE